MSVVSWWNAVTYPVGSKNFADRGTPEKTGLTAHQSLASQPLDFISRHRKLANFSAEHALPAPAMAHSARCRRVKKLRRTRGNEKGTFYFDFPKGLI